MASRTMNTGPFPQRSGGAGSGGARGPTCVATIVPARMLHEFRKRFLQFRGTWHLYSLLDSLAESMRQVTRHLPPVSNYRAIASAIGEDLRALYQPSNGLSPELRRLLRQIPCSSAGDLARRPQRSHEMWLTDGETRRMAEISLRFLSH